MKPDDVIALLAERYPKTFFVFQGRRRPLKIGIGRELVVALGDSVAPGLLGRALGRYCRNIGYLGSQKAGVGRLDLNGEVCGTITADEAANARRSIAGLRAAAKMNRRQDECC
jgi:sRNA-binding protein